MHQIKIMPAQAASELTKRHRSITEHVLVINRYITLISKSDGNTYNHYIDRRVEPETVNALVEMLTKKDDPETGGYRVEVTDERIRIEWI